MSEFKVQTRPDRASKQSQQKLSRHRAEPDRPTSAWARLTADIPSFGRRAAVVTTACAVLIGVGAASQAAEQATPVASHEAASATADAASTLNFDKTLISALPAPTSAVLSPQSATTPAATVKAPAAHAVPKTTAAKPAAAPAKAAAAPAAKVAPTRAAAAQPAAPATVDDPAGAQAYAASKLSSFGWAADQMQCLKRLWTKESDWRTTATNASSGAYGVVQSLPAEKMASAGADYRTNYRTQINWGLDYVKERYGSPCGALDFHLANNWY